MKSSHYGYKSLLSNSLLACSLYLVTHATQGLAETLSISPPPDTGNSTTNTNAPILDFRGGDIRALIQLVAEQTGKNFIVDPQVRGEATLVAGRRLRNDELYEALLSILQVHGYEAVETGNLIKIVPNGKARSSVAPLVNNAKESTPDETITQVVKLNYIQVQTAIQTLMPLSGQGETSILPNQSSNSLVLKGKAQNIQRLQDVIASIDKPNNEDFELVPLDYAVASQVASTLQALMSTVAGTPEAMAMGAGGGGKVSADERTNSVLISGDKATRERMKRAIAKLDVPRATEGDTKVIQLRYAKAEDVVAVLNGVAPAIQQQSNLPVSAGGTPGGAGISMPLSGGATSSVSSANSGGVKVLADKSSNSIILSGPPTLQKNMMQVINQLDRRRAQVLVEAVIAEVSTDLSNKIGAALVANGANTGGSGVVGYSNFGTIGALANIYSSIKASSIPALPNGLLLGGGNESFGAIVEALKGDAATNILSTPTLVTMDNQEAEITVGQEVPFITGQSTSSSSTTTNPFTTIERKDVGLKFKITPQINRGETVNLKIEQETSNVATSSVSAADLITNKRRITTNVMVEDGQILVLGGLIEDNYRDSESKVPLLGDLPIIGNVFRSNTTSKAKNNLMVFIHPVILPDGQSADAYTRMKYHTLRQQQENSKVLERRRLTEGASVLPPDMNQVSAGTADSLHNTPRTQQARPNNAATGAAAPAATNKRPKCNKSDPFCNGAL